MPKSQNKEKEKENVKKNKKFEEHTKGRFELKSVEKDEKYNCLKQGIPMSNKYSSITDIYKRTNRLSPPEEEYNWNCQNTSANKKSEVLVEGKIKEEQEDIFEDTLPNTQKQKVIPGKCDNLGSNCTSINNNIDNSNPTKNEGNHGCKGKSKRFDALVDLCKELGNKISEKCNESNIRMGQKNFSEEKLPDQQQDINGESELNRATCEDGLPDNSDHSLNDNFINCGSKLWTRDEKDENYRITQGIPRNMKFGSIESIYKCTNRLSPVEDEFNWKLPTKKDSNMNHSAKEDASIKTNTKNAGCKRKGRENENENKEKLDAATSSI